MRLTKLALALTLPFTFCIVSTAMASTAALSTTAQERAAGGVPNGTGGPFVPPGNLYDNLQSDGTTSLASQNSSGTFTARSADDFILTAACPSGQFSITQIRSQMTQQNAAPQAFALDLFADDGTNTVPAAGITPIVTLAQSSQTNLGAFGATTTLFEASFVPSTPLLLQANTRYWISGYGADATANAAGFNNFFAASAGAAGTTANGVIIAPDAGVATWTPAGTVLGPPELSFSFAIDGTCAVLDADLSVSLTASPTQIDAGMPVTYSAVASNAGPADAADLAISFSLPAGATLGSANSSAGGLCAGSGPVVCTFAGATPVGAQRTATFVVNTPTTAGALIASASVSSNNTDPVSANNTSSATVTGRLPLSRPAVIPVASSAGLALLMVLITVVGGVALGRRAR